MVSESDNLDPIMAGPLTSHRGTGCSFNPHYTSGPSPVMGVSSGSWYLTETTLRIRVSVCTGCFSKPPEPGGFSSRVCFPQFSVLGGTQWKCWLAGSPFLVLLLTASVLGLQSRPRGNQLGGRYLACR